MEFSTIIFEKKDGYAKLTLNRPSKLNALNTELFNDLDRAITMIENDRDIHLMVLTGSGEKAFAAGADIVELNKSDERSGKHFSQHGSKVMERIANMSIPTIAMVNGFALGGGCELAMSCHIRFASDKARFGQPEVNLGIIPGYGGTQRLSRLVGTAKAMELNISGNMIKADEALRIGLVNNVFNAEELEAETMKFVNTVLSKGQVAVRAAVDCVMSSEKLSPAEGLEYESKKFGEVCGSEDFREGTLAFIEKREPNFKNS